MSRPQKITPLLRGAHQRARGADLLLGLSVFARRRDDHQWPDDV